MLRWAILIEFVYVFLFPVIYIFTTSIKTLSEINNPSVRWVSRAPTLEGYEVATEILGYVDGLRISGWTSVVAAIGTTLMGAMVAYGFARLRFPGRELLFGFLLFTIVVPPQITMVPQFMLYTKLEWTNTYLPLFVPAFMGWGVRGGVLLIVYRQFFRGLPYELEDAAKDLFDQKPAPDASDLTQQLKPLLKQLGDIHTRLEQRIQSSPSHKTFRARQALTKVEGWHRELSQMALKSLSRLHMAPGA